jgi:hypothetical protein
MTNLKILALGLLLLLLSSCEKKIYTADQCNELSMNSFKGMPKAGSDFKKYCGDVEIKYTHQLCQEALNKLIISGDYSGILQQYGNPAAGCFTENDINKFRKR